MFISFQIPPSTIASVARRQGEDTKFRSSAATSNNFLIEQIKKNIGYSSGTDRNLSKCQGFQPSQNIAAENLNVFSEFQGKLHNFYTDKVL